MSKSKRHKPRKLRNDFARLFSCAAVAHNFGDLSLLKACLASGVNPDSPQRENSSRTLLFDHDLTSDVAKVLLDAKADPTVKDRNGFTPLHNANVAVAPLLLARGAVIEAEDYLVGGTPLLSQAAVGRADMVKLLLDRGANVDARTAQGYTAFSLAEKMGNTEVCEVIAAHQAAKSQHSLDGIAAATRPTYERVSAGTDLRRM